MTVNSSTNKVLQDNNLLGIGLMTSGIFLMSIKDAGSKFLVSDYHPIQIMALSSWLTVVILLLWSVSSSKQKKTGVRTFMTKHWRAHMIRASIGVMTGLFFLYSLKYMKLVDVTVIFFSAPILMTTLSAIFLKEKVGIIRWTAVFIGFIGVVIAMRPDMGSIEWKFVLPLCASITYSIRAILVRTMAGIETATQIVFHTRLGGAILTTIPMFYFWQPMTTMDGVLLIIITVVQLNAHLLITRSTVMASLSVVGPVEYSALLWNGMLGYIIWNEIPTNNIWIGAIFIIAAGLVVAYREALHKKRFKHVQSDITD